MFFHESNTIFAQELYQPNSRKLPDNIAQGARLHYCILLDIYKVIIHRKDEMTKGGFSRSKGTIAQSAPAQCVSLNHVFI